MNKLLDKWWENCNKEDSNHKEKDTIIKYKQLFGNSVLRVGEEKIKVEKGVP
jgi:hypothetical protein